MIRRYRLVIATAVVLIAAAAWYWYAFRPGQIRGLCQREVDRDYAELFDLNFQRQADGTTVWKRGTSRTMDLAAGKALREAADDKFLPCLRRRGLSR